MKKLIIFTVVFLVFISAKSQSVGFSYFFPKNGSFSNPIAPISFSLPLKLGKFFQVSPGIGMYNIGGMSMTGFPDDYDSARPLVGPFQSLELTLLPAIVLPFKKVGLDFNGGVFGFLGFNQKVVGTGFSNMLKDANLFTALDCNTNSPKSGLGWGFIYGIKLRVKIKKTAWAYIGVNYYNGYQNYDISGYYSAIVGASIIEKGNFEFNNSKILYKGFQISLGAVLK